MSWTPLHAALGSAEPELTFAMIEQAITDEIAEMQNLEFKRDLPLPPGLSEAAKNEKQAELAKDVAAMANAGGGMLIYGLDEDRGVGRSVAARVCSVGGPNEAVEKQIRQVAGNLVYPPVRHLEFAWLIESDATREPRSVLVLMVPDSADRPHLVHPKGKTDWFAAPYRDGADTHYMRDRMLQSAYVDRERGQRRIEENFEQRFADLVTQLPGRGWIVAMAVPENPVRADAPFDEYHVAQILKRGLKTGSSNEHLSPAALLEHVSPRRGLRRFTVGRSRIYGGDGLTTHEVSAYAAVHADGAVALAFTRDGFFKPLNKDVTAGSVYIHELREQGPNGYDDVSLEDLNATIDQFTQLLWAARQMRTVQSPYRARLAIHPTVGHFRVLASRIHDEYEPITAGDHRVLTYPPVEARLTDDRGDVSVVESIQGMIEDAFHQAGERTPARGDAERLIEGFKFVTRDL